MEDFLKDRPILDPKSALVIAAGSKPASSLVKPPVASAAPGPVGTAGASPFGQLRREPASAAKPTAALPIADAAAMAVQNLTGEHGTKVQTVVERGRVTKIIVTCTCGKVTEIACQY